MPRRATIETTFAAMRCRPTPSCVYRHDIPALNQCVVDIGCFEKIVFRMLASIRCEYRTDTQLCYREALLPVKRHYLSSVDRSAPVSRNRADIRPQQTVLAIASTQNASRVPHGVIDHFEIRHPITYHFTKFHFLRQWRLVERRLRVYITSIAHPINVTIRKR